MVVETKKDGIFLMSFYCVNQTTVGMNQPNFFEVFQSLDFLNAKGHPFSYEMVLIKGMVGKLVSDFPQNGTLLLQFPFYPKPLYVLKDHLKSSNNSSSFELKLDCLQMVKRALSCIGKPYLWGGNDDRVLEQPILDKLDRSLNKREKRAVHLDGIDCSGLLFFSSGYITPRNTRELQGFGVPIKDTNSLKPMDLILTQGHVAIIISQDVVIQSRQNRGVYTARLDLELQRLNRKKEQVDIVRQDGEFSIRRFIL